MMLQKLKAYGVADNICADRRLLANTELSMQNGSFSGWQDVYKQCTTGIGTKSSNSYNLIAKFAYYKDRQEITLQI